MDSALRLTILICAALLAGCGPTAPKSAASPKTDSAADVALEAFHRKPDSNSLDLFLKLNGFAAREHGNQHDGAGVHYQVRALEAQALGAVTEQDDELAFRVAQRIDQLGEGGFFANFEDVLPGARERLEKARAQVSPLVDRSAR